MKQALLTDEEIRAIVSEEMAKLLKGLITAPVTNVEEKSKYLTQGQVAARYHVSKASLISWGKTNKITAYRLNGRVLYLESELEQQIRPVKMKGGKF